MRKNIAVRVSAVTVAMNIILALFKFFAGIAAHSSAMISDAVHSVSDVISTFVVIVGVHIGDKKSDRGHPYGHERLENVASIILSVMLFATGAGIGINALKTILSGNEIIIINENAAIAAAVVSIIIKEWMYRYTKSAAKKIKSEGMMADAWHHRSDAFSSVGSLAGILGAKLGVPILDPVAGILICCFIIKAAADIFIESVNKMVDKACDEETQNKIIKTVESVSGVIRVDLVNTRMFGARIFVDIEFSADADIPLRDAHAIAQQVHDKIETEYSEVKHCMVHVNPYEKTNDGK